MAGTILVIEDDPAIVEVISHNLQTLGIGWEHASDGEEGLKRALANDYLMLILDINVPRLSGLDVCRRVRAEKQLLPILMLTGCTEEIDRVLGLELGADDYVTKPFSVQELKARIRALLRRSEAQSHASRSQTPAETIIAGDLEIDLKRRKVRRSGMPIDLSNIEFELLAYLATNPGVPIPREDLVKNVWGSSATRYESTVNAQLSRLRRKIENDPNEPLYIKTVWGFGYEFTDFSKAVNKTEGKKD